MPSVREKRVRHIAKDHRMMAMAASPNPTVANGPFIVAARDGSIQPAATAATISDIVDAA
jgi:hypothetical protein